jgi:predicted transglutaminase-like cysteine proteinase
MYHKKIAVALFGLSFLFTNIADAELFGSSERKSRNINEFPKWVKMLERLQEEEYLCAKNNDCLLDKIATHLKEQTAADDKLAILKKVNRLVNSINYVNDSKRWEIGDYWATPTQFFEQGGDCEDYAIAKFTLLKRMGFKNSDMRVVVLNDTFKNIIHSVLVVFIDGKQYFLDNQIPKVLQTKEIRHYKPIFSINEKNWWKHRT